MNGWCIESDKLGTPIIVECSVKPGAERGLYLEEKEDVKGDCITLRTYRLDESFFLSKESALRGRFAKLSTQITGHQMMIAYLEDEIEKTIELLELERAGK